MHEHAILADLMRQVLKSAVEENAGAVVGVSVWIGALSHMTAGHFAEHFEQAAAGTIAAGATIDAVVSDDIHDPNAGGVVLTGVEVEATE